MFEGKIHDDVSHLLMWLNREQQIMAPEVKHCCNFSEARENGLINGIFAKVTGYSFQGLSQKDFYARLTQYLNKVKKKRFSLQMKKKILETQSDADIVKVLIYLCVHSTERERYISHILELPEKIQHSIMNEVQMVSSTIQNYQNHEDIVGDVEKLQYENEAIREILEDVKKQRDILKMELEYYQEEVTEARSQRDNLLKEKADIINKCKIFTKGDYKEVYESMSSENERLTRELLHMIHQNEKLEAENKQKNQTIKNQNNAIVLLSEELEELNDKFLELINKVDCQEDDKFEMNESRANAVAKHEELKQTIRNTVHNTLAQSCKSRKFFMSNMSHLFNRTASTAISKQSSEISTELLREEIQKLKQELESAQLSNGLYESQLEELQQEVADLKLRFDKVQEKNSFYVSKIHRYENLYEQLMSEYPYTDELLI